MRTASKPIQVHDNNFYNEFSNGKALKNNSSLLIFTHYKHIGYLIIPKPHFSSREGTLVVGVLTCCFSPFWLNLSLL